MVNGNAETESSQVEQMKGSGRKMRKLVLQWNCGKSEHFRHQNIFLKSELVCNSVSHCLFVYDEVLNSNVDFSATFYGFATMHCFHFPDVLLVCEHVEYCL